MSSPNFQEDITRAKIYYQVGDKKTFSKAQAIIWANGQMENIRFYFMDDTFDQLDWTVEPGADINTTVVNQAKKIREQHSWVSLLYSGGYDSQTVVDVFMYNGLLLDEIIVLKKSYLPADHWQNLESDVAVAQATTYKKHIWPNLSIKVVLLSAEHTKDFFIKHKNNWVDHAGNDLWMTRMSRQHLYNYQIDLAKTVETQHTRAIVEGREKPRLLIENDAWYATTIDALGNWDINSRSLQFYFEPELYLKQTWGMLNWLESFDLNKVSEVHTLLHQVQSHKTTLELYRDWNYSLGRTPVHNMYSYNPMPLKGNRWSGDPRLVEENKFLFKYFENTPVLSYYKTGINEYMEQYGDIMLDSQKCNIWSKKYFIKKVEPGKNFKINELL